MAHSVVFAPEARDDLRGLYLFIAERSGADRAIRYIERILYGGRDLGILTGEL